jgi:hypothetical protein
MVEVEELTAGLCARRSVVAGTGCWEWRGRRDRWGCGRVTVWQRRRSVHRVAASLLLGFDLAGSQHVPVVTTPAVSSLGICASARTSTTGATAPANSDHPDPAGKATGRTGA